MKCLVCGKNSDSEYCFQHKPRKQLAINNGFKKPALTKKLKVSVGKSKPNTDHLLFKAIWKKRSHNSELSGDYLGKEAFSTYFHHILPKNKYPEIRMDEENIILLTLDEHADVESDMYKYDIINQRRTKLLKKHELY